MQKMFTTLKDKITNALILIVKSIFIAAIAQYLPIRSYLILK